MSLVIVGSVAYDSVETQCGKRDNALGGSATFFSLAASHFLSPELVAVVGEDFAAEDRAILEHHGIGLDGLKVEAGETFRWGGKYHEDMIGRDTLFTALNVFEHFKPELSASQRETDFLFLGNIQPELQLSVLDQVERPKFVAADTMNLWLDIARPALEDVVSKVDGLFLNDEEARQLTGERSVVKAAAAIRARGPRMVVVKRGEHGALTFFDDDMFFTPAFPLEAVVDPTGAGDTFAGGFMGYLAVQPAIDSDTVRRAAVVGSILASFCVEGFSVDHVASLERARIVSRYEEFKALTHVGPVSF